MKTKTLSTIATLLSAALWFGCATNNDAKQSEGSQVATAHLNPTQGNNVRGTVTFTQLEGGVRVVADVTGLKPGPHGFHIHENSDCSASDASSAGGHFNPKEMPHGAPDMEMRHVGDLGNLQADASGRARMNYVDRHLKLRGPNTILERAVIVHEKRDDLKSQPSGDAGSRVACGVIALRP